MKVSIKEIISGLASYIFRNKLLVLVLISYLIISFTQISWGLPNSSHPFDYSMDEWQQVLSLRSTFTQGTPQIPGGGNGTFLFYVVGGLYLIPMVLLHIANPMAIHSSLLNFGEQARLFEVLRSSSIMFGAGSIILVGYLAKRFFKGSSGLAAVFFTFIPIFLLISNFYRYDTPVIFWILLSLWFSFRYKEKPVFANFIISGIISATAIGIKVSAIPLFLTFVISFFLFTPNWKEKIKTLLIGVLVFVSVAIITSIPDALISFNVFWNWFMYSSVGSGKDTYNYLFGLNYELFLLLFSYPATFGWSFYIISIFCIVYSAILYLSKFFSRQASKIDKNEIFLFISLLVFLAAIIPLKIGAHANRMLIFLPFIALINIVVLRKIREVSSKKYTLIINLILMLVISFQIIECEVWLMTKLTQDPRELSSQWILRNIPRGSYIGIENIPLYEQIPNVLQKDFYTHEYFPDSKTIYKYKVLDARTKDFPPIVIISNANFTKQYLISSEKKDRVLKLEKSGYKQISNFTPNFEFLYNFHSELAIFSASFITFPQSISVYKQSLER